MSISSSLADRMTEYLNNSDYSVATLGYHSTARPIAFLPLLQQIAAEQAEEIEYSLKLLKDYETFSKLPIIGICGTMNTGKSSTTAYHLSEQGRARITIGNGSNEATHRFVLWLPTTFKNDQAFIIKALQATFGHDPELLADDSVRAASQYNAKESRLKEFEIPLLAFDSKLNQHGLALLDCPDIQRRHDHNIQTETASLRARTLSKAARLCSAFFMVTSAEQQESEAIDILVKALQADKIKIPLYYIVTKVHEPFNETISDAKKRIEELGISSKVRSIFVSPFLYENRKTRGYPEGLNYFDVDNHQRNLYAVTSELDIAELQSEFLNEQLNRALRSCAIGRDKIKNHFNSNDIKSKKIRDGLLDFLQSFFYDEENQQIRHFLTKSLLQNIKDSFDRTMPWYLIPGQYLKKGSIAVGYGIKKIATSGLLGTFKRGSDAVNNINELKHSQKIHSIDHNNFVKFFDGKYYLPLSKQELQKIWDACIKHLNNYAVITDSKKDQKDLDLITEEIWEKIPILQKAISGLALPVALLAGITTAVFLAPLSLGGAAVIHYASIAELFAAMGLGAMASLGSTVAMQNYVAKRAGRRQISALFALLQDALGIDRIEESALKAMKNNVKLRLEKSDIPYIKTHFSVLDQPYGYLSSIKNESDKNGLSYELGQAMDALKIDNLLFKIKNMTTY